METVEIGRSQLVVRLNHPLMSGLLGEADFVLGPAFEIILFFVRHRPGKHTSLRCEHNVWAGPAVPQKAVNLDRLSPCAPERRPAFATGAALPRGNRSASPDRSRN